jgi:hypothetical protein
MNFHTMLAPTREIAMGRKIIALEAASARCPSLSARVAKAKPMITDTAGTITTHRMLLRTATRVSDWVKMSMKLRSPTKLSPLAFLKARMVVLTAGYTAGRTLSRNRRGRTLLTSRSMLQ